MAGENSERVDPRLGSSFELPAKENLPRKVVASFPLAEPP